jgi:hypothetical protein
MTTLTIPAAFLAPASVSERRRAGRGLLAFGVAGIVLLLLAGWLLLGSLGAVADATADLDAQRVRLAELLPPAEQALEGAADSAANAGTSLQTSGQSARDASDLVSRLALAMDGMSSAAQIEVLGVKPFGTLSDDLGRVASESRTLAADLILTASSLDKNVLDSQAAASDLRALASEVRVLHTELVAGSGAAAGSMETTLTIARAVVIGLLLWLAVPAVVAAWLGWRWSRK